MAYFKDHKTIKIVLVLSNRKQAGVLQRALKFSVPTHTFNKQALYNSDDLIDVLQKHQVDLIVLAGFLLLIPPSLIQKYEDRIINIHPALLPKYGGKGMYGQHVHQAVFDNKELESGMTIHLVNEEYDKGEILCQKKVSLDKADTPEDIASKVLKLEHAHYATVIEDYIVSRELK